MARKDRILLILAFCIPAFLAFARQATAGESEVAFTNGPVVLKGSMIVPDKPVKHPALVFVHGSGCGERSVFLPYARYFTEIGIASLIYDKRGCGQSGGSWTSSSLDDLARDAAAAVNFLRTQPQINPHQMGLWAISQGGWIAPVAANMTDLAFMIIVSGGGVTPRETELYAYRNIWNHEGVSLEDQQEASILLDLYFDYMKTGEKRPELLQAINGSKIKKWYSLMPLEKILPSEDNRKNWSWVATFDPMPSIKSLKMPVLLLFGALDQQQPTNLAVERWREGLSRAGNNQFQIKVFPEAGHAIRIGPHHDAAGDDPRFAEGYFETMSSWLQKTVLKMGDR